MTPTRHRTDPPDAVTAALGSIAAIVAGAALVPLRDPLGNTNMALLLVVVVVAAAALGGSAAGAATAVTAGLSFNFFHTKPYLTLRVDDRKDFATIVILVIVGLVVGEIAVERKVRKAKRSQRDQGVDRVRNVIDEAAGGAHANELWPAVRVALIDDLGLRDAQFHAGSVTGLALLHRDARIHTTEVQFTPTGLELPVQGVELPVEHGGERLGYVLLEPTPGHGVGLPERRLAIVLADLLAASLARGPVPALLS